METTTKPDQGSVIAPIDIDEQPKIKVTRENLDEALRILRQVLDEVDPNG